LPAHCYQPAVAGSIIYADLWGELSTHLAPQALFTQSFFVHEPLLQAFPFPSTLGEVTLHPLSQACVFVYSSRGKWVFPPLLWSFPTTAAFTSFPTPYCWVVLLLLPAACLFTAHVGSGSSLLSCGVFLSPPLLQAFPLLVAGVHPRSRQSSLARPGLFIYSSRKDSPLPPSALRAPHPLCYVSLLFLLLITQLLFFPWVGVGLSRGLC
jgi:hypothetical protein